MTTSLKWISYLGLTRDMKVLPTVYLFQEPSIEHFEKFWSLTKTLARVPP